MKDELKDEPAEENNHEGGATWTEETCGANSQDESYTDSKEEEPSTSNYFQPVSRYIVCIMHNYIIS